MLTLNRFFSRVGVVLVAASLAGCSGNPTYPPAPVLAPPPVHVKPPQSDWLYLLGPGDSVNVFVWRNPEVSGSFPIRPDGKIREHISSLGAGDCGSGCTGIGLGDFDLSARNS